MSAMDEHLADHVVPRASGSPDAVDAAAYGTVLVLVALSAIEVARVRRGTARSWSRRRAGDVDRPPVRRAAWASTCGWASRSWAEARRASIDGSPIGVSTLLPAPPPPGADRRAAGDETARNLAILAAIAAAEPDRRIVARSTPGSSPRRGPSPPSAWSGLIVVALKVALGTSLVGLTIPCGESRRAAPAGRRAPKVQPPRNLSGHRTTRVRQRWSPGDSGGTHRSHPARRPRCPTAPPPRPSPIALGPRPRTSSACSPLGVATLDELIDQAVPKTIRTDQPLMLEGRSEQR